MTMPSKSMIEVFDARSRRREDRRAFFKTAIGAAAVGTALSVAGGASAQTAPSDADILNFALNLEYLEGAYYNQAAFGQAVSSDLTTGVGTQGGVTGGRQVNFTDPVVADYAREIAYDELAHIRFLRSSLDSAAVAQPAINIAGDASGALWAKGLTRAAIYTNVTKISDTRDSLDGGGDTDQDVGNATTANIVPADSNGLALGRSAPQVLNVVYQNRAAVSSGGFFPAGVNGTIRTSAANA